MSTGKVTASTNGAVDNSRARRDGRSIVDAAPATVPDPEVVAKPTRPRFTAEYKLRILREADSQCEPGAIGALLRREGLYVDGPRSAGFEMCPRIWRDCCCLMPWLRDSLKAAARPKVAPEKPGRS